ncbi:CHAT domain-containing protein, partial [Tumidithrix helvetica]|uniref:CHAT domain-containing tetratricopeptide repeat protein n=1 Tax=Tumidithrix helvetica TaxID=3457545 RepID=UPI003CC5AB18
MNLQIEIIGASPEFQAWHWEALCDPELPRPFAVDCGLVRKYTRPTTMPAQVKPSPVVNVLLVVARPDEEDDVGYRTISRTLVELVDSAQLRINVEILRPATYKALVERLTERGAGYYHILHFDGHGALLTYADYKMGLKRNRYLYQRGYGLGDLVEYAGSKAFLFFDGDKKGQAVPVEATDLAGLLTGKQIPVCILNACQSAKQLSCTTECANETSLGSQLMAAGMQAVVAMGYSVTTVAAKLFMRRLYEELFANRDFYRAVRMGRQELFHDKQRRGYFNTAITLEDRLLPVVYASDAVDLNLCEFTPAEEEQYYERLGSLYRFEPPNYGFVGRDLEILKIEKALLKSNALLLRGMGGTGKTTLLNYLRQWWVTTNFAKDAFYFGYDEKAWTLEQIIFEIGKQVYDRFEQAKFAAMNLVAQLAKLGQKLKSENYVLMLDNLESVTGQQLAIANTLNESEQKKLRDFLRQLVGGKTKVVLGSRSGEEWLKDVFKSNIYGLQGLDLEARTLLADRILEQHVAPERIESVRADEDFKRLMKVLAGYPLAMEVVLANLKRQTPKQILTALQAADIDLDKGSDKDGEDKTSSILKCVEYSHSNLSESAQKLLLCLAPFSGFIRRDVIHSYAAELQKLEPFQDYDFTNFDDAIQEAMNWGLLSPMAEGDRLLTIQPVFPYFLQVRLSGVEATTREALSEGFKNHYLGLAGYYNNLMESKTPQEKQLGTSFCRLEYENLYSALQISIEKQESISIYFCLAKYFRVVSDVESGLKIAESVNQALEKYPSELIEGELEYENFCVLDLLAYGYLYTKQFDSAKGSYEKNLQILKYIQSLDKRQNGLVQASTYHQLGIVAQELRQWDEAKQNYLKALEINVEFGDRYSQSVTYIGLGSVAQALRQWEEAKANYLKALEIDVEFSDRYSQ